MISTHKRMLTGLPLLMAAASCVPAQAGWSERGTSGPLHAAAAKPAKPGFSFARTPPASSLRPLARADEAQWQKAAGQFDAPSATPAAPFLHRGEASDRNRARDCLATAIYYEARSESVEGQKAVAQVVLNRVRHPAFPSSVCAVVYQGSARRTGCQFSFTCDGSLALRPAGGAWQRALGIAAASLAGQVYAPVGNATHYHTRAILPYWAGSLSRAAILGAHVFYRWRGGQGETSAFRQQHVGLEQGPAERAALWRPASAVSRAPEAPRTIEQVKAGADTIRVHRGDDPAVIERADRSFEVRVHVGAAPAVS